MVIEALLLLDGSDVCPYNISPPEAGVGGVCTDLKQEVNFSEFSTPRVSRVIGV